MIVYFYRDDVAVSVDAYVRCNPQIKFLQVGHNAFACESLLNGLMNLSWLVIDSKTCTTLKRADLKRAE